MHMKNCQGQMFKKEFMAEAAPLGKKMSQVGAERQRKEAGPQPPAPVGAPGRLTQGRNHTVIISSWQLKSVKPTGPARRPHHPLACAQLQLQLSIIYGDRNLFTLKVTTAQDGKFLHWL
jgi:hypothetical protein